MKSQLFKLSLLTLAIGALLFPAFTNGVAQAGGDNPALWDGPVKIVRVSKPRRKRPATAKVGAGNIEEAPLLTLKYNVIKRGDAGAEIKADASKEFQIGDQVKLAITPNQDGFLYIVHRSTDTAGRVVDQPHIIFPDPRINEGSNLVRKDREYVVPGFCSEFEDPKDCWWEITPPNGREFFTVIFSRDEITDLPDKLTEDELINRTRDGISQQVIDAIKSDSKQVITRTNRILNSRRVAESDGTYVRNTNTRDNEELVETIELKHSTGDDADAYARARALFVKKRTDSVRVDFLTEKGERIDPAQLVFKAGDAIDVKFQSNFRGYAYFINVTPSGKRCVIYPCTKSAENFMKPGLLYTQPVGFDEEKGTEVLQVIVSRERIKFLDDAIKGPGCCNPEQACGCELNATASSAASELASSASRQQQMGVAVNNVVPVVPQGAEGGIRARGITLTPGKDKNKGTAYVAIDDRVDNKAQGGQPSMVFEIRLKHN